MKQNTLMKKQCSISRKMGHTHWILHKELHSWQPNGNQMATQYSIGKSSTVKSSEAEESIEGAAPPKSPRHKYGLYKNVIFTDEEYQKLQEEFPHDYTDRIERLSEYIASTGKKYKNHLATIRSWARKDAASKPAGKAKSSNPFLDMVGDGYE